MEREEIRLPLLTEELLQQIMWCMENQDSTWVLDIKDKIVVPDSEEEEDGKRFLSLPDWGPAQGYNLMVSFTQKCGNPEVKKTLLRELNSQKKGVFRRFRDVLGANPHILEQWYAFKDKQMASYIRAWFNDRSLDAESLPPEESTPEILLQDFSVEFLENSNEALEKQFTSWSGYSPLAQFIWDSYPQKKAFVALSGEEIVSSIIFAIEKEGVANIIFYETIPSQRGIGLFKLLFDHFNGEMARLKIQEVKMTLSPSSSFLESKLEGIDLKDKYISFSFNPNQTSKSSEEAWL